MLRIFYLSVVLGMVQCEITDFYPNTKKNLTLVTWEHAVNNAKFLNETLKKDVMMIEADVVMGKVGTIVNEIPIMAHPPNKTSDISLEQFIGNVTAYNKNNNKKIKGMKLDFKSIEAFTAAVPIIQKKYKDIHVLWLNADILKGPVNSSNAGVDAKKFLDGCKTFEKSNTTLSLGWTTTNYTEKTKNGSYNQTHVTEMIKNIADFKKYNITFPVRAMYAENNATVLKQLLNETGRTLTIWSGKDDKVDIKKLENLIKSVGVGKVYLDVPQDIKKQLRLGSGSSKLTFGLVTIITTLAFTFLYNQIIN